MGLVMGREKNRRVEGRERAHGEKGERERWGQGVCLWKARQRIQMSQMSAISRKANY